MTSLSAATPLEIAEAVRSCPNVRLVGGDSSREWRRPVAADAELKIASRGVLEHDADDQVVVVSGGATIEEVQEALSRRGQCLPLGVLPHAESGTVAGQLSMNLPHSLQHDCGSWRDWVLGLTVVRPDGTVVKCGSKAVKNVAGYDVAKLFIGARGTLGVIAEVILRTYPLRALPAPDLVLRADWPAEGFVQRVLPTDFAHAREREQTFAEMPKLSTVYVAGVKTPARFDGDWLLGWGQGERNVTIEDPALRRLMERSKAVMDPGGKLNPGEFY